MKTFNNISDLQEALIQHTGFTIGFVPTMGALHEGHLSLVRNSIAENDITVVSVFVNPRQFNDPEDLKKYPRNLEADLKLLEKTGCDWVFNPDVEEIYPDDKQESFAFGHLETIMEGQFRPGHFNGVAQVVSRLFRIVKPTKAYFGLKDYQQVAIIRKVVQMLDFHIDIIACPIIREPDGLAMSSRNQLLSKEERKSAAHISRALFKARKMAENNSIKDVKKWVVEYLNAVPILTVEYFEIVDEDFNLIENRDNKSKLVGCIAVQAGKVRLIDNVAFS